jgi:hypothetical protein
MMEKKATDGYTFPWTTQLLVEKGKEPKVAADKFVNACQSFDYILGHYGTKFDFPVINKFIHSQCGMKLPDVSSGQLVDTAIIVKAAKVGCIPKLGESYLSFMQRVDSARKNGILY